MVEKGMNQGLARFVYKTTSYNQVRGGRFQREFPFPHRFPWTVQTNRNFHARHCEEKGEVNVARFENLNGAPERKVLENNGNGPPVPRVTCAGGHYGAGTAPSPPCRRTKTVHAHHAWTSRIKARDRRPSRSFLLSRTPYGVMDGMDGLREAALKRNVA